jgi:hypothetical protein
VAVCVVKTRNPRVSGKKSAAASIAYSAAEKSPSGPIAAATDVADDTWETHSDHGRQFSSSAAAILNISFGSASNAASMGQGGKICGRNGFLDCLQASMAICRQRSSRLPMWAPSAETTPFAPTMGKICVTPNSVAWWMIWSMAAFFTTPCKRMRDPGGEKFVTSPTERAQCLGSAHCREHRPTAPLPSNTKSPSRTVTRKTRSRWWASAYPGWQAVPGLKPLG